jgi:hypothetical protein
VIYTIPKKGTGRWPEREKNMMHIEKKTEDRKNIVKKLEEILGTKAVYQGMPSAAYRIGDYTVTRSGALEAEEEKADYEVLNTLYEAGLIEEIHSEEKMQEEAKEAKEAGAAEAPAAVAIALPMDGHTGATLRNLVNLLYQRASLINKATGAVFAADAALAEALQTEGSITKERFFEILKEHKEELTGLEFTEDKITFTGFADCASSDVLDAEMRLACFMNRQALSQKRIQPKAVAEENEKYSFRIWLIRMGMKGEEYKEARKILLKNLSGNCAFRTEEEARAFSDKQKAKRLEAKKVQA